MLAIPEAEIARLADPARVFAERQHPGGAGARPRAGGGRLMDARATGLGLASIQEINALPREMAEALYLRLVPGGAACAA